VTLIRLAALFTLAWFAVGTADAQAPLSIVTTAAGSFTNNTGSAIAKVMVEKAGIKTTVVPQQSHGQEAVNDGSAELSLATISDVQQYVTGTVDWKGKGPKKNIRLIARIVPLRTAGFVRLDSPIKSLQEVRGKRVPTGFPAQRAVGRMILAQLATAGLTEKDVVAVPVRNIIASANDFMAGKIDVFWFALGSGKVRQVAAKVGGLRALPISNSPEAIKAMNKYVPGSYTITLKPSKRIAEIRKEMPVMAYDLVFFTNKDASDDVVYKITKALYENKPTLASVFKALNGFQPKGMAKKFDDALVYHPGAIKFYKEKGMWPPKTGS
jgi:TRAP transporter TAXI family solute receptor